MIKAITTLKDHLLHDVIIERFNNHPEWSAFCRFTLGELKNLAAHESKNYLKWTSGGHHRFLQSLTQFESNEIGIIQRYTRESKLEQQKQRVKSRIQFTERVIRDLVSVVEQEESLREQYEALQTARTRIGSDLEQRFK